jgi:peptide deformylase
MVLKILQYPNPILQQKSQPVLDFNKDIAILIDNMIHTCKKTSNCVGLAAIQIGVPLRISVIKDEKKFFHIINPVILHESKKTGGEWEGCMSIGTNENQLFSKVDRDNEIEVSYFNKHGEEIVRPVHGFLAHAFQHEIDHMEGILFLSHVKDPMNIWKDKDLNEYIKKHNQLPT